MTDTKTDATSCVHEGVHYTLNNLEPGSGAWVMRERGLKRYRESVGQTFGVTTIEKILGYDVDDIAQTRGLQEAHERMILGDHYDTVRRWELEDDSLETAMKTGELPEPEETK